MWPPALRFAYSPNPILPTHPYTQTHPHLTRSLTNQPTHHHNTQFLYVVVNDLKFYVDKFGPFLDGTAMCLFHLIESAVEDDTKLRVLNIFCSLCRQLGPKVCGRVHLRAPPPSLSLSLSVITHPVSLSLVSCSSLLPSLSDPTVCR